MKKISIIIGALILGILGCSKDSLMDSSDPAAGNSQNLKKADIITYELKAVNLQNHPTQNPMIYTISGNISHMGAIDPLSTITITAMWPDMANPAPDQTGKPTNFFQTCIINMIGADGSSLSFVTSAPGTFSYATGYGETNWTISSGTGRFEGATGWYKSTSQFDFATMINHVTGDGEVFITKK